MKRRIISLFMSLLMILSVFPVYALADTGTTGTDGEVTVTKELLSKEPDADGNYTIRLTVKGNPLSLETGAAAGDIVLVIDNSGSMTDKISAEKCTATRDQILENLTDTETKGKKDKKTYETYTCPECDREYTIIRDSSGNVVEDEVPDVCTGHINGKQRMEVAIDAGKEFAGDILEYNEYNRFAVIGFAGSEGGTSDDDAIKTTLGLTSDIDDINNTIDSMAAKGGTNYTAALNTALGILNGRSDEDKETRPGFVIFITDGAPGYSGDGIGDTDWDGSVQAQAIKDAGYTLYTVGLQLDSDSDECEYLESLASTPSADHFINIDSDNVEQELKDILAKWAKQIVEVPAGYDAVLKDVVTDDFNIEGVTGNGVTTDGQNVTWNIGEIPEDEIYIDIKISPKDGLSGTSPTNEECVLEYKDHEGETQKIEPKSPTLDFVKIDVEKVWDDSNYANRPTSVEIGLNANGSYTGQTVELSEGNNWKGSFSSLPVTSNGTEIEYEIIEVTGLHDGYVSEIMGSIEDGFVVTNSRPEDTREITITKEWDDADNQDGKRPDTVKIHIIADDENTNTPVFLTEENNWTETLAVKKYDSNGSEIVYTVEEDADSIPTGYTSTVTQNGDTYTVTNSYIPEVIDSLVVTKSWDDNDNNDGKRPASVTIRLLADGVERESRVLTDEINWQTTFTFLPKYNNGKAIVYSVSEDPVEDYSTSVSGIVNDTITVTNTYPAEAAPDITVTKEWNDDNNRDGIRPDSVTVKLLADGEEYKSEVLSTDNSWLAEFTNLPMYNSGKTIVYTIEETAVEGYTTEITGNAADGFTITNTHEPAVYDPDDPDDSEYGRLTVTKIWDDTNNNDGKRPESITVYLMIDNDIVETLEITGNKTDAEWIGHFRDEHYVYENGDPIDYTIAEDKINDYTLKSNEVNCKTGSDIIDSFTITNSYSVDNSGAVNVTKVWDDAEDQDGIRPDSVTVTLYANGDKVDSTKLNADNEWTHKFTDLAVYEDGEKITYTVDDIEVPDGYTKMITGDMTNGYTVTNSHTPAKYDPDKPEGTDPDEPKEGEDRDRITVTKVWEDDNNRDGKRPESITVKLMNADEEIESLELTAADNWTGYFKKEIPVYADGEVITYTVVEDTVADYTVACTGKYNSDGTIDSFTVTNTHEPEKTSITVNKAWNHKGDANAENPSADDVESEDVTVHLLVNGQHDEDRKVTLNAGNKWTHTYKDLYVYENGKKITYTVVEDNVVNYTPTIEKLDDGKTITITNVYTPKKTSVTIEKIWDDADNQDGERPERITVGLYYKAEDADAAGDHVTKSNKDNITVVLDENTGWSATISDLDENHEY